MKTSGFREIDFSLVHCTNCEYRKPWEIGFPPKGMIVVTKTYYPYFTYELKDCPVCKGTGFIDESVTTELELE